MRIRCIFHEIKDRLVTILKLVNIHLKFSQFSILDTCYINATKFAYTLLITIHA